MKLEDQAFNSLLKYTKALSIALGYRDLSTQLHSERVQGLCVSIGKSCGLSQSEINTLIIAASFHDIGKIGIPDHILFKPSKLDPTEWETMKKHSEIGAEIMLATELEGSKQAALPIRHHHEHYNGMGYPDNLMGESIPICSRIISIADCYDALAVTRSYHHVRTHLEIMDLLHEESGKKYDPEIMRIFCKIIETNQFKTVNV